MLSLKGPLLIAANHPNSFLDAIIVDTLFKEPVTALTRGDVFRNKFISKILKSLNMLPVYRVSEGVENLEHNYSTFKICNDIFKNNGVVLIFSEGGCVNEWHLRSLKKGTARLAFNAWQEGIPLQILPLGINYSSFRHFGKDLHLNFGSIIKKEDFLPDLSSGMSMITFNKLLYDQLKEQVYEHDKRDADYPKKYFTYQNTTAKKIILAVPAILGYVIHYPIYYVARTIVNRKPNDHYDSILVGILFFLYPVVLLGAALVIYFSLGLIYMLAAMIILPFCGWAFLQLKPMN